MCFANRIKFLIASSTTVLVKEKQREFLEQAHLHLRLYKDKILENKEAMKSSGIQLLPQSMAALQRDFSQWLLTKILGEDLIHIQSHGGFFPYSNGELPQSRKV